MLDLLRRLKLPLFDGMEEALRKANDERAKKLEKLKTDEFKKKRIALKRKKEIEQEVRKQWLQEQETSHGYGNDDEAHDDDDATVQGGSDLLSQTTVTGPDGGSVVTSKKTCKCGSTEYLRTSHHECPIN